MKVLLINGSPRENGNTFTALNEVAKTLNEEGVDTEIINIGKQAVQGCIACRGGASAVFDRLNKYFTILNMPVVYYAILEPMRRIHNAPEFPVLAVEDKEEGVTDDVYRKRLVSFGEKICDNCYYLKPAERNQHQTELKSELAGLNTTQDIELIKAFLDKEIKQRYKAVDGQILKYGSKVFIITAISSSSMIDTIPIEERAKKKGFFSFWK